MPQGKLYDVITLKELFSSSTAGNIPILLDVQHDDLVWEDEGYGQENGHLRLINSTTAVMYAGHKYLPGFFQYTLPSEDGSKISNTSITISAIDGRVIEMIRKIYSPPKAVVEAYFSMIGETEFVFRKLNHYEFQMNDVQWNEQTAKWNLEFDPTLQLSIPVDKGTISRCPSAFVEKSL